MGTTTMPVGDYLRDWRRRRRMSQLDLACEADISTRHLSFLETGRAQPSRAMVLHLAERLEVPLRERNVLLVAAGYAPTFPERPLDDPALHAAREAVDLVLAGHEPYPALAVDRHWTLVAHNRALPCLMGGVDPALLRPPANSLRVAMHPDGMAPRILNYAECRDHWLAQLRRQIVLTGDPVLVALLEELSGYPLPRGMNGRAARHDYAGVGLPLKLRTDDGVLTFFSTITTFGTPLDITLSELAIESMFPADPETAERLRAWAASPSSP